MIGDQDRRAISGPLALVTSGFSRSLPDSPSRRSGHMTGPNGTDSQARRARQQRRVMGGPAAPRTTVRWAVAKGKDPGPAQCVSEHEIDGQGPGIEPRPEGAW
jgi:hypothetical protein